MQMDEQQKPQLKLVKAPEEDNRPKWKVAVYSMVCDISTVYADTPEEAMESMQKGFGRHAGVEGPIVVGSACVSFDSPASKDFIPQWMVNIQRLQAMVAKAQSGVPEGKIVVPKMVVPKGIV